MAIAVDVNLFCDDPEKLCGFYRDLLGFPENEAARGPLYRALRLPGGAEFGFNKREAYALLGIAERAGTAGAAVSAFVTFNLDSEAMIDDRATAIAILGGRIVKPAYRTYYGAWQVLAEDPERNVFRLNCRTGQA